MERVGRSPGIRHAFVGVVAVIAGVGTALAGAEPTSLSWWNVALGFAVGALVTVLSAQVHPLAWMVLVAPALAVGDRTLVIAAALAYVVTLVAWFRPQSTHLWFGSVVGAVAAQTLIRLPATWFFGFPSLVAAIVVAVLALTAWWALPVRPARWLANAVYGLSVVTLAALLLSIPALAQGRDAVDQAEALGREGLRLAEDGDVDTAADSMVLASTALADANEAMRSPWVLPARLVPVVSQHLDVARVGADVGSDTLGQLSALARSADVDAVTSGPTMIDLQALRALHPAADQASTVLADGASTIQRVRNPWLIPALADPLREISADLAQAADSAGAAADAAATLPDLLGESSPRRYLLIFGQPAEAREIGGLMSVYAVLQAEQGAIEVLRSGRWSDLEADPGERPRLSGFPSFYADTNPQRWPANLTGLPDLSSIAKAAAQIFPTLEGAPLDGVIYVDPLALQAVLTLTGPLRVDSTVAPGSPIQVSAPMIVDFLVRDQYLQIADVEARHLYLASLLDVVIGEVTEIDLPELLEVAEIFESTIAGNHLQIATLDAAENEMLRGVGLQRDFAQQPGEDFLSVLSINTAPNKLDAYAWRTVAYEATVAPGGQIDARVTVQVESRATQSVGAYALGVEYQRVQPGEHRTKTVIYTPHEITGAWIDGEPTPPGASSAYGLQRYTLTEVIPPGATVEFMFSLAGQIDFDEQDVPQIGYDAAELDDYALTIAGQPLVNPDELSVMIRRPAGERTAGLTVEGDYSLRWTNSGQIIVE